MPEQDTGGNTNEDKLRRTSLSLLNILEMAGRNEPKKSQNMDTFYPIKGEAKGEPEMDDDDDGTGSSVTSRSGISSGLPTRTTTTTTVSPIAVLKRPKGWGRRHTLSILGCFGFMTAYAMRFSLSLAIVVMVRSPENSHNGTNGTNVTTVSVNALNDDESCKYGNETDVSKNKTSVGEFEWTEYEQGLILGSFFWGYIITQMPGGWAASVYGGKWLFAVGLGLSGVMTLLTPLAARINVGMLLWCRFIEGLAQGVIFPAIQQLIASWAPPNERSFLSGVAYSGCQIGSALSLVSGGYLINGHGGWPSIFYFTGAVTLVWFLFWIFFVFDTPEKDPCISQEEKDYIIRSIGVDPSERRRSVPWISIITSGPVWVIAISELCHCWGLYTLLIELPTYFRLVLGFDIEEDSWLSALPNILTWAFGIICTLAADIIITKKIAKTLTVRKTCHLIAEVGSGLFIIAAALVGCDRTGAVVFLALASMVAGAVFASYIPNQVEIACNYAGAIMGFTNTIGNLAGFTVPVVTSQLTKGHTKDQGHWRHVFFIAAGVYFLGALIFVIFATEKEQPWNRRQKDKSEIIDESGEAKGDTVELSPQPQQSRVDEQ